MPKSKMCPQCGLHKRMRDFRIAPETTSAETNRLAKTNICQDCQRGRKRNPMSPYVSRDFALRAMGYASYKDYLASPLWSKIRARVLKLRGYKCEVCGGAATQVHHNVYGRRELSGQSLKGMKALCRDCHRSIEFDAGRKLGAVEVSHRFYESKGMEVDR